MVFFILIYLFLCINLSASSKGIIAPEQNVALEHVLSEYFPIFLINKYYISGEYFKKNRDFLRKQDENYIENIWTHNQIIISFLCKLRLINTSTNCFIKQNQNIHNCLIDYLIHFNCIRRRINEPIDCEAKELSPFFKKTAVFLWNSIIPCSLFYVFTRPHGTSEQLTVLTQNIENSNVFYTVKYATGTLLGYGAIDTIIQSISSNKKKIIRNPIENTFRLINTCLDFFKQKKQIGDLHNNIDDFKLLKKLLCEIKKKY